MDLSDRTILVSSLNEPKYSSLAEAVYNGLSAEYFRYQKGRLSCLLDYTLKDRKNVPLLPSDPKVLYDKGFILNSRVHPLINPNCPFKVQFVVGERVLPIYVAVTDTFIGPDVKAEAVVNLEPGDEPTIRFSNTLSKRVLVAVFIDGINILGKERELPDESCHAWVLEPNKTLDFKSWWIIEDKNNIEQERFIIQDWAESVAGKMGMRGDADTSRTITIVVYSDGFADRNSLAFFERSWLQRATLSPNRQSIRVSEHLADPNGTLAAPNLFGMGAKKAVPGQLNWVKDARVGTLLASMTVWYCPSSDTKRLFTQLLTKQNQDNASPKFSILPIQLPQ